MNFLDIETGGGWTSWSNPQEIGKIEVWISDDYFYHPNRLVCNGSAYLTTKYPLLFDRIGYKYGRIYDNGVNYFKTPDFRNKTLFMNNNNTFGVASKGKIPNITGTFASFDRNSEHISNGVFYVDSRWSAAVKSGSADDWGTRIKIDANRISSIYQDVNYVEPANLSVIFTIKAW